MKCRVAQHFASYRKQFVGHSGLKEGKRRDNNWWCCPLMNDDQLWSIVMITVMISGAFLDDKDVGQETRENNWWTSSQCCGHRKHNSCWLRIGHQWWWWSGGQEEEEEEEGTPGDNNWWSQWQQRHHMWSLHCRRVKVSRIHQIYLRSLQICLNLPESNCDHWSLINDYMHHVQFIPIYISGTQNFNLI